MSFIANRPTDRFIFHLLKKVSAHLNACHHPGKITNSEFPHDNSDAFTILS